MCMCIHICVYIYTHIYLRVKIWCAQPSRYIDGVYIYMYICVHIRMYVYMYISLYIYTHNWSWFLELLQHTATHCNTLQHTATHCNTLQHIHNGVATKNRLPELFVLLPSPSWLQYTAKTLQHCCNTHHRWSPYIKCQWGVGSLKCEVSVAKVSHENGAPWIVRSLLQKSPTKMGLFFEIDLGSLLIVDAVMCYRVYLLRPYVAVCCRVLQCVAAWCVPSTVCCETMCCSVLQCVAPRCVPSAYCCGIMCRTQCVVVCCCVLQCVAVCCSERCGELYLFWDDVIQMYFAYSVLQRFAAGCSVCVFVPRQCFATERVYWYTYMYTVCAYIYIYTYMHIYI